MKNSKDWAVPPQPTACSDRWRSSACEGGVRLGRQEARDLHSDRAALVTGRDECMLCRCPPVRHSRCKSRAAPSSSISRSRTSSAATSPGAAS
eukprot:scaffold17929_cov130-Isochrysis_galbana.AAC.5